MCSTYAHTVCLYHGRYLDLQYFYGNGVFRSTFVGILIGPKASVLQNWFYSWINSGVQVRGMDLARLLVWPLPCAGC